MVHLIGLIPVKGRDVTVGLLLLMLISVLKGGPPPKVDERERGEAL
jgi:hypothetical protein